jgi:hypothetical protein
MWFRPTVGDPGRAALVGDGAKTLAGAGALACEPTKARANLGDEVGAGLPRSSRQLDSLATGQDVLHRNEHEPATENARPDDESIRLVGPDPEHHRLDEAEAPLRRIDTEALAAGEPVRALIDGRCHGGDSPSLLLRSRVCLFSKRETSVKKCCLRGEQRKASRAGIPLARA